MTGIIRIDEFVHLLPMHLVLDTEGEIVSAGPTLRKLIGPERRFDRVFALERPFVPAGTAAAACLAEAAADGRRLFLRLVSRNLLLRGHAILAAAGTKLILNLGFGISLPQAVRQFELTDADFAPSDLAMELLFLFEANGLAGNALADANARLDDARRDAETRSLTDPLTGLANRRGFDQALEAVLAMQPHASPDHAERRHAPDQCAGFAVMHLDLDHFKEVNDSLGHAAGDAVLQHVAGLLGAAIRAEDTIARSGGDEFTLLLPGLTSDTALLSLARRIIAQIEAPFLFAGHEIRVSASIGISVADGYSDVDPEALTAQADSALYAAKRNGRGHALMAGAETSVVGGVSHSREISAAG